MKTLVVNNFHGSMTQYQDGDINSGLTNETLSYGYDPFVKPGNLTWSEAAVRIDPDEDVITDMIVAGKGRIESGITYTYAIGHTGRLYKIQSNDPNTYNPNYDNPVLLTTLTAQTPTFTRGGFIDFYGATEKIYIGHDKGVTSIDFDGTGEAFVGVLGSWIQDVPRPLQQFLGKLCVGNGPNIAEIDTTATVTTYGKLDPAFPQGTQTRDMDVNPEGTYLQIVVSEQALADITATVPDTTILLPSDSWVFKWNGTDAGYTSFVTYPNAVLTAASLFGPNEYIFGYDFRGCAVYNPIQKIITSSPLSSQEAPMPNAVISISSVISWISPLPFEGTLFPCMNWFGTPAAGQIQAGYWSPYSPENTGTETDARVVPCTIMVSNFAQGAGNNGYTDGIYGAPKVYISIMEISNAPTKKYKLYKWSPSATGLGTAEIFALYQTQVQLFSKKIQPKQIRVYGEPWIADNSFTLSLIGSSGAPMTNGEKTFTAQSSDAAAPMYIGTDYAWWTPDIAPTYALGLRFVNEGSANMTITKVEIDYEEAGQ